MELTNTIEKKMELTIEHLTRKQLYILYGKIGYGYLIKNYSRKFIDRVKQNLKVLFVDGNKGVVSYWCKGTGNDFRINIDLKNMTIKHLGCYSANKGYDAKKLIEDNINTLTT